jgi:DNA-binding beta-propeller fold protein YncE
VAVGSRRLALLLVTVCYLAGAAVAVGATGLRPVQTVPLPRATGIAVSPDGRLVVARSGVGSLGALTVFRRGANGKLRKLQCVTRHARRCLDGRGLETPSAIAIPRDGANLYVTAANGQSVGSYRIVGGKLALAGSVAGLAHPLSVAVSPDGATVYVGGDRIWIFDRARGGGLVLRDTIAAPARALAATATALYAASSGSIVAYAPDGTEVGGAESPSLKLPSQLAVAHGFVYAVSLGNVSRWTLSLESAGTAGALPLAFGLAVTDRVYVAYRDGVAAFALDLRRAGTRRLDHATGVAGWGRSVYAVSRAGVTVLSR